MRNYNVNYSLLAARYGRSVIKEALVSAGALY